MAEITAHCKSLHKTVKLKPDKSRGTIVCSQSGFDCKESDCVYDGLCADQSYVNTAAYKYHVTKEFSAGEFSNALRMYDRLAYAVVREEGRKPSVDALTSVEITGFPKRKWYEFRKPEESGNEIMAIIRRYYEQTPMVCPKCQAAIDLSHFVIGRTHSWCKCPFCDCRFEVKHLKNGNPIPPEKAPY